MLFEIIFLITCIDGVKLYTWTTKWYNYWKETSLYLFSYVFKELIYSSINWKKRYSLTFHTKYQFINKFATFWRFIKFWQKPQMYHMYTCVCVYTYVILCHTHHVFNPFITKHKTPLHIIIIIFIFNVNTHTHTYVHKSIHVKTQN